VGRGIGEKSAVHMGRKGGEKGVQYISNFKKGQYIRWLKIKGRKNRQYI
jgi:hypothetical protein